MAAKPHTPASLRIRAAVRRSLGEILLGLGVDQQSVPSAELPLVLVALSGGADSLALAAACATEAKRAGFRAGAVVVDHGLQNASAAVARRAAEQARGLGLDPLVVRRVEVATGNASVTGGVEAAARDARYLALGDIARELGAIAVFTGHTRDDQAEQVLLGLARGSGTRSLAAISPNRELTFGSGVRLIRPLLAERPEVFRRDTSESCRELGLEPWHDPHNVNEAFARVRVRARVLPTLEHELGPGVAKALARSADLAREDADALDAWAESIAAEICVEEDAGRVTLAIRARASAHVDRVTCCATRLAELPPAIRHRIIRMIARERFSSHLTREHTREIAALVTNWRGQGPIHVPGIGVFRENGLLVFYGEA